jgi:predicted NUDIX family NTP pyrophosphohydrolase
MKRSAGILAYRFTHELQVFLVHPGGPFFKNKDAGAWTIPKGEILEDEEPLAAAQREFFEETGFSISGDFNELKPIKQKGGKLVLAWAIEKDFDETKVVSNTFEIEWPPKSSKMQTFPEVDKAGWFSIDKAKEKVNPAQVDFIDEIFRITNK